MKRRQPEPDPGDAARALEHKALWALEHPEQIAPRDVLHGLQRRLRLWSYPARGTPKTWALFVAAAEGPDDSRPLVREVAWAKQADARHTASPLRRLKRHPRPWPGPTLHVRDAELFLPEVQPFLEWAARAGFQPPEPAEADLDGDTQGIEGSGPLTHLRIEWRGTASAALQEPAYWIDRLRRLLEAALQERGRSRTD